MTKKKLITSALPYVNNAPHLGNIIGCVLSADVFARFCRGRGYDTLYICATDEYGTATENKARQEGATPREICDKFHLLHRKIYKDFNISFDYFGRTSYPEQEETTQDIYRNLNEAGMILEKETDQVYCEHDRMFLADRYVAGACPHCGYNDAGGDQCESCGKLLQPDELLNPQCRICGGAPVKKSTKHLYIDLPKLEDKLKDFFRQTLEKGKWTKNAIRATQSWLESGLNSRPITRDLSWGVKVPRPGYENKVFYVWFDAPIGYISNTKRHLPDAWKDWWLDNENVELCQFMAKDNIPFHTIMFPAFLIGSGQPWTLLRNINATEYLNYESRKFSKSRNVGIFGDDVVKLGLDVDLWRFYLLYNRPEKSDSNFTWETFLEDINSNFIDNIGNLLNRVLVFFNKHFGGRAEKVKFAPRHEEFLKKVEEKGEQITAMLEEIRLKEALANILALGRMGNKFFQDERPWETIKTDPSSARASLTTLLCLLRDVGITLSPYMPGTSQRILAMLGQGKVDFRNLGRREDLDGVVLAEPELLFKKLRAKEIKKYKAMFDGDRETETDKKEKALENWKNILVKVGEIKSVEKHPSADLLYVEKIECGEERPRVIVSGLVKHYAPEELLGKKILMVANLEPVELRGVASEGMLLAAETGKKMEILEAEWASPGELLSLENAAPAAPAAKINIKQFLAANIRVKDRFLSLNDEKLTVDGRPVKTELVVNGKVR